MRETYRTAREFLNAGNQFPAAWHNAVCADNTYENVSWVKPFGSLTPDQKQARGLARKLAKHFGQPTGWVAFATRDDCRAFVLQQNGGDTELAPEIPVEPYRKWAERAGKDPEPPKAGEAPKDSPEAPKPAPAPKSGEPDYKALFEGLRTALGGGAPQEQSPLDLAEVQKLVDAAVHKYVPKRVEIVEKGETRDVGDTVHELFPRILAYLQTGNPVYLVGPAGGGKSTLFRQLAEALQVKCYPFSCGDYTQPHQLLGFQGPNGYVRTDFRDAFEHGGLFLLDEADAANPNVFTTLNNAISAKAGETISFPDGLVEKHEKCYIVANANTFGRGADKVYVGRNVQDGATLDRFINVDLDYDEKLERLIAHKEASAFEHYSELKVDEWVDKVISLRKSTWDLGIRHLITPRASIFGAQCIASGIPADKQLLADVVWKGLEKAEQKRITDNAQ